VLWEVELEGLVIETRHKLTARRGRLVRPVAGYPAAVKELAELCAWRARDRAVEALGATGATVLTSRFAAVGALEDLRDLIEVVDDATWEGTAAALAADAARFAITEPGPEAPFIDAFSAGHAAAGLDGDQAVFDEAYAEERAWQSGWLTARLGLSAT
jgi:hypothetical protein